MDPEIVIGSIAGICMFVFVLYRRGEIIMNEREIAELEPPTDEMIRQDGIEATKNAYIKGDLTKEEFDASIENWLRWRSPPPPVMIIPPSTRES